MACRLERATQGRCVLPPSPFRPYFSCPLTRKSLCLPSPPAFFFSSEGMTGWTLSTLYNGLARLDWHPGVGPLGGKWKEVYLSAPPPFPPSLLSPPSFPKIKGWG